MSQSVLITIGHPASDMPILPLVKTDVKDSVQKAAKNLRKSVADNPKGYSVFTLLGIPVQTLVPSDLYWACFENSEAKTPFLASDNYWCREALKKEYEKKANDILLSKMGDKAIKMISLHIHEGKCPNCQVFGLSDGHCTACGADICPECFAVLDDCMQCGECGYGLDL